MSFIYNTSTGDFELHPDKFSDRSNPCPCRSGKQWKDCGAIKIEEHNKNVLNLPDWEKDKETALQEMQKLLNETESGNISVNKFAYLITQLLLPYKKKMTKIDPWYEQVFNLSGTLEVDRNATKEDPSYLELKQLITKGLYFPAS